MQPDLECTWAQIGAGFPWLTSFLRARHARQGQDQLRSTTRGWPDVAVAAGWKEKLRWDESRPTKHNDSGV